MYNETMKSFLRKKYLSNKIKQNNYQHVIYGLPVLGLIIIMLLTLIVDNNIIIMTTLVLLNILYIKLNYGFISYVESTKDINKIYILPFCYLDSFLMLSGSVIGFIDYYIGRKY